MPQTIVPMIHVPDVRQTAEWYTSILGFELTGRHEMEGGLTWAKLTYGGCSIMLNCCGKASDAHRREFDLYIFTSELDDLYSRLHSRVEIVETPHDTEYGMREFILRDVNRFWITFGEPIRPVA